MKIVQVVNHFYPCLGGMERIVEDISEKLVGKKNIVKVVCLNTCANSKNKLKEKEIFNKIQIERIPFIDLKYYKIALSVFDKIKNSDVVHVHGIGFFSDFLIATKIFHKKPIIVSTHGGIFHTQKLGVLKKIYFYFFQKIILKFANTVIAVSKNDYELFKPICNNLVLIENGVNTSKFKTRKKQKNTFLYLGRFSKNKQIPFLLNTFAELKKKNNKFTLIIAGTDWENLLYLYKQKVSDLGLEKNVSFVINPLNEETKELYANSEYFVSASRYEGFGLTIVEAMASGTIPLVQYNEGHSITVQDKKNGYFIDYTNAKKAAKTLQEILQTNKISSKDTILRAKEFDWNKQIEKIEKIYSGAL